MLRPRRNVNDLETGKSNTKISPVRVNGSNSKREGRSHDGKHQKYATSRNAVWLLCVTLLMALSLYLYLEIQKGTDGSSPLLFFYYRIGNLDNYQKTEKKYKNIKEVLETGPTGTFVGSTGFNTDKDTRHNYTTYYDVVLFPYYEYDVSVVEVGVRKGGSIKMWRELFSTGSYIWGVDIDPQVQLSIWGVSFFRKLIQH